jgi:hypothetical protein
MTPPDDDSMHHNASRAQRMHTEGARTEGERPQGEGRKSAAPRLLVLNGRRDNFPLDDRLIALGYDVVADTASPEQVLSLTASVLPDGVLVVMDSLDRTSALITIRHIRDRHRCAVIVLTGGCDADVDRLRAVQPHGVVPWPVADGLLDVSIKTALSLASEQGRPAQPAAAAPSAGSAPDFEEVIALAAARAARSGLTFAVGAVEISPSRPGADFPEHHDVVGKAAVRLRKTLRQTDVVVRRGERQLLFVAEQVGPREIPSLGARMVRSISDLPERGAVAAAPSIGMALWKSADDAPRAVLEAAEQELVEAKRPGRLRWRVADAAGAGLRLTGNDYSVVPSAEPSAPLSVLQRLIGGLSLAALVWVLANYAGITSTERLSEQAQRLVTLWR